MSNHLPQPLFARMRPLLLSWWFPISETLCWWSRFVHAGERATEPHGRCSQGRGAGTFQPWAARTSICSSRQTEEETYWAHGFLEAPEPPSTILLAKTSFSSFIFFSLTLLLEDEKESEALLNSSGKIPTSPSKRFLDTCR